MQSYLISVVAFSLATVAAVAEPGRDSPTARDVPTAPGVPAASAQPNLWIDVRLPAETRPAWIGDDVAGLFAERVGRALRDQGFVGEIGVWRPEDKTPKSGRVLELHLLGWETRDGYATCEFRAVLHGVGGRKDLGLFASDELIVTPDGRPHDASAGLRDVERQALSTLWVRILAALEPPPPAATEIPG